MKIQSDTSLSEHSRATLETPVLLLDGARLRENIRWMQEKADAHGLLLVPHIKTHKCFAVARMQLDAGAAGITASKPCEALAFIEHGFDNVTVAYPIVDPNKLDRLLVSARERGAHLRLVVDSEATVEAAGRAASRHAMTVETLVEIDVGLRRCGLRSDDPALLPLVRRITSDPLLRFAGLLSHAGHAYGAESLERIQEIAREEWKTMVTLRRLIEHDGIDVGVLSVGSTPTVVAGTMFDGLTEVRPGNYVFMDGTQLALGITDHARIALTVLATVVSVNADHFIIDAGSKTLSSDRGAHGTSRLEGYGSAYRESDYGSATNAMTITRLSEEHGFIARTPEGPVLEVGARVRIVPNHSCVVANLSDGYGVMEDGEIVDRWPVNARGLVQ